MQGTGFSEGVTSVYQSEITKKRQSAGKFAAPTSSTGLLLNWLAAFGRMQASGYCVERSMEGWPFVHLPDDQERYDRD